MSTAILYLAIVAIWAGVLVPRLLRRAQQRSSSRVAEEPVTGISDLPGEDADADAGADSEVAAAGGTGLGEAPACCRNGGPRWPHTGCRRTNALI